MALPLAAIGLGLQGAGALGSLLSGAGAGRSQKKLANASENLLSMQRKQQEMFAPYRQQVLQQLAQSAGITGPLATPRLLNPPGRQATQAAPVAPAQAPAGVGQPSGYDILGQRNPFLSGPEGLRLGAIEEALANRQRLQQAQLGSALERRGLAGSATLGSALGNLFTQGQRDYGQFARQLALEGPREQERRLLLLQGLLPGGTSEALALAGGLGNLSAQFGQQAALGGQALGQFGQSLGYLGAMPSNPYANLFGVGGGAPVDITGQDPWANLVQQGIPWMRR